MTIWKTTGEELDALTSVDDHLEFAANLLTRWPAFESVRDTMQQHIAQIRARRDDPNLYLAMVGEFNSGKTTFINALLRHNLLRASSVGGRDNGQDVGGTTATATYVRYGTHLHVEVQFIKGANPQHPDEAPLVKFSMHNYAHSIDWLPQYGELTFREFIDLITTDNAFATMVERMTLYHPAAFLADNHIVMIDIPGTSVKTPHHRDVVRRVISEVDAAILLIDSTRPVPRDYAAFLKSTVTQYIHRCLFVVTRMDGIRTKEQSRLISEIQARLARELEIEPPEIHMSAAQAIVDDYTDDDPAVETRPELWKQRFVELEAVITQHLKRERIVSIAESLLRLLNRLFEMLHPLLHDEWAVYNQRQQELQREVIPDLDAFTREHHELSHQRLATAADTLHADVDEIRKTQHQALIDQVNSALLTVTSHEKLKQVLSETVQSLWDKNRQELEAQMNTALRAFTTQAEAVGQQFDTVFFESYRRLERLQTAFTVKTAQPASLDKMNNEVVSLTQNWNDELNRKVGGGALRGAAVGAAVGTFVPIVGTLFGGVLGLVIGGLMGRGSLDKQKQQLQEELHEHIKAYYEQVQTQTNQLVENHIASTRQALDERIDTYVKQYRFIVDDLYQKQQREHARLAAQQNIFQAELDELDRRRGMIRQRQQQFLQRHERTSFVS